MLAALFIQGGINELKAPQGHAQVAKTVLDAMSPMVDKAVEVAPIEQRPDEELLIKIDAGVKIAAGSLLAVGKFPRLAAAALAASLIPTTLASHRFWEETDEQKRQDQQVHFLKNVGLLGGLLIAAADTEGKPSLAWRGRRAATLAAAATAARGASVTGTASDVTGKVTGVAQDVTGKLTGTVHDASGTVAGLAAGLAGLAPAAGAAISTRSSRSGADLSSRVGEISAELSKRAAKARKKAEKRAAQLQRRAAKKRPGLLGKKAPGMLDQATKLGHDVAARASALGAEVAHQAEGAAKDARKRAHALTH